jgi:nucleoid-associated protein YgaU
MPIKDKYLPVLKMMEEMRATEIDAFEERGALRIKGRVESEYVRDLIMEKIISIGGEGSHDVTADIEVEDDSAYHFHIVREGDTIEKISMRYLGDEKRSQEITNINEGINNDSPAVGTRLKIPKR